MTAYQLSTVGDDSTSRTRLECAVQRAENLAVLGAKNVLELCVGPSLQALEIAYGFQGISCTGNDIDVRWKEYYPGGNWVIGDAMKISWEGFDTVVFAPPLSVGCNGERDSALMINDITPSYRMFIQRPFSGLRCMVLPARSFSTNVDRRQFFSLLNNLQDVEVVPLTAGKRRIRKYVDVYYKG